MPNKTDDLRIREITALVPPVDLIGEHPRSDAVTATVADARATMHDILHGSDDRLIVVIGPCSIHDPIAARDYAERLMAERRRLATRWKSSCGSISRSRARRSAGRA